jgi:type III pantothenate kinase
VSDCNDGLLLDIGNTRLHWRYGEMQGSHQSYAPNAEAWPFDPSLVQKVCYCAVAKAPRWQDLQSIFHQARWYRCEVPEPTILATDYVDTQLGIDRWLAMVGALKVQHVNEPCLVVDVGTALTFDVLKNDTHFGGFICPGIKAWAHSITSQTNISVDYNVQPRAEIGRNTVDAISNSWLVAARSMVTQIMQEHELLTLVLTGGDAKLLKPYFPDASCFDNLVLDGLAYWSKVSIKSEQIS